MKPIFLQKYPVLNVHEEMFKKEVKRLVLIGFLEIANNPEWISTSFAQPKPESN